ncbi:MAG: PA2779 family protein [Desulfobacterales bacterium]|nr:PA2779 family protein [Desulfobacterales bacterium]
MKQIFRFRKFIGLMVSITIFLLYYPHSAVQAGMVSTEHVIHQVSEQLSDRARIKAFFERADVMAYLKASGIRYEEALSRVDSLTDKEIALIAGRLDQIPEGAESTNYEFDGSLLAIIGLALYVIFAAIAIYFSRTVDKKEKSPQEQNSPDKQLPEPPVEETSGQQTPSAP